MRKYFFQSVPTERSVTFVIYNVDISNGDEVTLTRDSNIILVHIQYASKVECLMILALDTTYEIDQTTGDIV